MIHIVGLGPGDPGALTLGTWRLLQELPLYLRTRRHPTVDHIIQEGIAFTTFDAVYEAAAQFEEVYETIAQAVTTAGREEDLVYGVPGHPLVAETSVTRILEICRAEGLPYQVHPAVSFLDAVFEALEVDPIHGLRVVDALTIEKEPPDFTKGTVITQVFSQLVAGRVKLALSTYLGDEEEVVFLRALGTNKATVRRIPLYALDRQKDVDDLTSVYVPPKPEGYDFYGFLRVVERLRDRENGCPWDMEQTHASLKRYLIEEAYETLEAVDLEDSELLAEELGDVLLQVLLHSVIGAEAGEFNVHEVIRRVSEKMVYRHPHVFQKERDMSAGEVLVQWEALKKKEKQEEGPSDALEAVSKYYPALLRADKIQRKAGKYGFDWADATPVYRKIQEETAEIQEAVGLGDKDAVRKEVGDLLFAVVNLARFLEVDPELSLNGTSDRFIARIKEMESMIRDEHKVFEGLSLEELDEYWEKAKKREKN